MRQQRPRRSPRGSQGAPAAARDAAWAAGWVAADRTATEAMDGWLAALDEPFEGAPFPVLAAALPDGGTLWAGNSMPVRDMDGWLPSTDRAITVRSNRGANGIDGVVSTALGSAAVGGRAGRARGRRRVVPPRPQRARGREAPWPVRDHRPGQQRRRRHLLVPAAGHRVHPGVGPPGALRGAVRDAARDRRRADRDGAWAGSTPWSTAKDLGEHVERSIATPGVQVLELRTERARNVALHREVAAVVAAAIRP